MKNTGVVRKWLFGAWVVLAGLTLPASGTTIIARYDGLNPNPGATFGRSVIDPANSLRVTSNNMSGGRFTFTKSGGTITETLVGSGMTFLAYCIEPREFVNVGVTYNYNVSPLEQGTTNIGGMGLAKADKLRELFGRFLPDFGAPLTLVQSGALQIAIWEIVREDSGTLDVYNGDIYFFPGGSENPAGVVALAQTYVQAIDGTGPKLNNLLAFTATGGVQDLVVQYRLETPEPGTYLLVGMGLVIAGLSRRRKTPAK